MLTCRRVFVLGLNLIACYPFFDPFSNLVWAHHRITSFTIFYPLLMRFPSVFLLQGFPVA